MSGSGDFVADVRAGFWEAAADAVHRGEAAPTLGAYCACGIIVATVAEIVQGVDGLKWAAGAESDGIELVFHSVVTRRQLTLTILADGRLVVTCQIGAAMACIHGSVSVNDASTLRALAHWVVGHDDHVAEIVSIGPLPDKEVQHERP